jgi:hypothetical protein
MINCCAVSCCGQRMLWYLTCIQSACLWMPYGVSAVWTLIICCCYLRSSFHFAAQLPAAGAAAADPRQPGVAGVCRRGALPPPAPPPGVQHHQGRSRPTHGGEKTKSVSPYTTSVVCAYTRWVCVSLDSDHMLTPSAPPLGVQHDQGSVRPTLGGEIAYHTCANTLIAFVRCQGTRVGEQHSHPLHHGLEFQYYSSGARSTRGVCVRLYRK